MPHARRRGKHDRAVCQKPVSHAEQAWNHLQKVEGFSIGRPCTHSCKYGRNCGANITPALLLSAHEHSYGCCKRVEEGNLCTFHVERRKSETMSRWRQLASAAITVSNDGEKRVFEKLTVCKHGPVCQDYWAAAYGIPKGTANALLANARSGRLDAEVEYACGIRAAMSATKEVEDVAMEMTVQWWEMWLELEDQLPNEAAIQHRTVVWQSVYELEYIPDIQWWGICRALSRSRWVQLRHVALRHVSIRCFGHVEGSPDVPLVMLSLVERPKHSNFGMCNACAAAKDKWVKYRRCANVHSKMPLVHSVCTCFLVMRMLCDDRHDRHAGLPLRSGCRWLHQR